MAQSNTAKYDKNWEEYFYYDETSPSCLRWKIKRNHLSLKDGVAGSNNGKRYWHVMLDGRDYAVHRIIWVLKVGGLKDLFIDHVDGDSHNNTISNLRLTTLKSNSRNKKRQKNNNTGISGVTCISNGKGNYYWCAAWNSLELEQETKCFSINKMGMMPAFQAAAKYRQKMMNSLNAQGAGYSERHGKDK